MNSGPMVTIASYNVHRCTGIDRRRRPDRVVEALRQLGADVIGIQEIDTRDDPPEQGSLLDYLARETGLDVVMGPAINHADGGFYGNLLLTRFPVEDVRLLDLGVDGREPRSALDVDLRTPAGLLRVLSTHLGLTYAERCLQVDRLLAAIEDRARPLLAVIGDFNEWLPVNQSIVRFDQALGATLRPRTFPAWRPLLPLDRIWVRPVEAVAELRAVATRLTTRASDHLPVCARVRWPRR